MDKKIIFSIWVLAVALAAAIAASQSASFEANNNVISYKGISITPYINKDTALEKSNFDWVIKDKSFYVDLKNKQTLSELHYKVNKLATPAECFQNNLYQSDCYYEKLSFDKFMKKNKINSNNITPVYSKECNNPLSCVPESYLVSFYGEINDTDPEMELVYASSTNGYFNQTEATSDGIKLSDSNLNGDFKYYVYYNATPAYWNVTLGHNATGSNNITLQTRTADDYNISDESLIAFFPLNNNSNDIKAGITGNILGDAAITSDVTVGNAYSFDGAGDYINASLDYGLNNNFTITAWVYKYANCPGERDSCSIVMARVPSYENYWAELYESQSNQISFALYDGSNNPNMYTDTFYTDRWYFLAAVRDTILDKIIIYIDGQYINEAADSTATVPSYSELQIGGQSDYDRQFNGTVDEVRIYNRSLSASEIENLYKLGSYHLNWNDWSSASLASSGVPITSSSQGKFMQFKANLNTNDSAVSPYLFNHSIMALPESEEANANESEGRAAIESGIDEALESYVNYTDQQIYLRNKLNNQSTGRFDKVAVSGNQRWLINYVNATESYTNMFNITPAVCVLEMANLTATEITEQVQSFIDNTKI